MPRLILLLIFLLIPLVAAAQSLTISGQVVDSKSLAPIRGASVVAVSLPDSVKRNADTGPDGKFAINGCPPGRYLVRVSMVGYLPESRPAQSTGGGIDMGTLRLTQHVIELSGIEIHAKIPPAMVRDDTTEYSAASVKMKPDATAEELVAKAPGVVVQDGKVQAQGEDIKQVLVDGRRFFGDDPIAVLRNLPADVVDKVQVFDKASDQAQFTGFDDGNTTKTMNIVTRSRMRYGDFGKFSAGGGSASEYKAAGTLNSFNGARRYSLLGMLNNVNEQNFSIEDMLGAMGGGGRGGGGRGGGGGFRGPGGGPPGGGGGGGPRPAGMGGGANMSDFMVSPKGGITTTRAAGGNYSDQYSDGSQLSGSYFFNSTHTDAATNLLRQYVQTSGSDQIYNENDLSGSNNINHRLNGRLDWQIDSSNSILIQPRLSVQQNDGVSDMTSSLDQGAALLTSSTSRLSSTLQAVDGSSGVLLRHRFERRGRTISLSVDADANRNSGDADQTSTASTAAGSASLVQHADLLKSGWSLRPNLVYTEPIDDQNMVQLSYRASFTHSTGERSTFTPDSTTGAFDQLDSSLTSNVASDYLTQSLGAGYRIQSPTLRAMVGANLQSASLKNNQIVPASGDLRRTFRNFLPQAMVRWRVTRDINLFGFYRASTNSPSVDQLQHAVDNSNSILLSRGNPGLSQSVQHNVSLRYSAMDMESASFFFIMMSGSVSNDYIANSTVTASRDTVLSDGYLLRSGIQMTQPVNLDGYASLRAMVTYGIPVELIGSNVSFTGNASVSRTPGLINGVENRSTAYTCGLGVSANSNISQDLDFSVGTQGTYQDVRNALQSTLNTHSLGVNTRAKVNWIFWEGFFFNSDVDHQYSPGLSEAYSQNTVMFNVALGKRFLANNAGELRLSVFDVLNQNRNVTRTITDSYVQDSNTNVMQRYALLTFTYTLRSFPRREE
jgi:hypothetical protein